MDGKIYTFYLGVNYQTKFGENLYVVGSIPELGNWNPEKGLKLNYHDGYDWTSALRLDGKPQLIQYKYVVYNAELGYAKWEDGENRVLNMMSPDCLKPETYNIEQWNHREVVIRIKYDCGSKETLAISGDYQGLGYWRNPLRMTQVTKKDPLTGQKTSFWQRSFFVRHDIKRIKYRFVLITEEDDCEEYMWEREPDRVCDFVTLDTTSPYKTFQTFPNKKDSIKFRRRHNKFVKYDCNFVSEFFFNPINENLYVGPYPQNQAEIDQLAKEGVRAVFNLQTKHDMRHRSIDWEYLRLLYHNSNIKAINFSIIDMCAEDIFLKAFDAASYLNELVEKYDKVYVHCTAGIGRAPHVVAAYLMFFRGYSVEDVIKFIKEKRPVAYLSREVLSKAFSTYSSKLLLLNKKKEGGEEKVIVSSANVKSETNNGNGINETVTVCGIIPTQFCGAEKNLTQVEKEVKL